MAGHLDIEKLEGKFFRKVENSFRNDFLRGCHAIKFSSGYAEITSSGHKEHADDMVFKTFRKEKGIRKHFEIHFDKSKKILTKIYLVE